MRGWFPPIFISWLCGSALDFVVLFPTLRFCSCLRLFCLCVTNSSFRNSGPVIGELKMESWELGVAELECRVGTCICNLWVESCKFYIQNNKTSIKSIRVIESMPSPLLMRRRADRPLWCGPKKLFIQTFLKLKHNAIINLENTQITSWSTIVFSCVTEHFPTLIELSGSRTNKGRTIRKVKERGGGGGWVNFCLAYFFFCLTVTNVFFSRFKRLHGILFRNLYVILILQRYFL